MNTCNAITRLHHTARAAVIVLWGVALYFVLTPTNVFAKKASRQTHGSRVLMSPSNLPGDAQTFGDDMYLDEGNAKTYLYVEQDGSKRLVVLDVTNPDKILNLATIPRPEAEPYDFVGPYGDGSVLVRYRRRVDGPSIWRRLTVNTPRRSPIFVTWRKDCGVILDPLNNQAINVQAPRFRIIAQLVRLR